MASDGDLSANSRVLKRAMLNGVIEMEQDLRKEITRLRKGDGLDFVGMYLGDCTSQLDSLGVQPTHASDMIQATIKISSTGIGEKQAAVHVLLAAARDPTAVMARGQFVPTKFNRFVQLRFNEKRITIDDLLKQKEVQSSRHALLPAHLTVTHSVVKRPPFSYC